MYYNPFAYIHSEKDILKLVTTLIANTYVQSKRWTTFDEMQADRKALQGKYDELEASRSAMSERMAYLEKLLNYHEKYEPYQKVNAEYWKLKKAEDKNGKPLGFFKKSQAEEYKRKHQTVKDRLKRVILHEANGIKN